MQHGTQSCFSVDGGAFIEQVSDCECLPVHVQQRPLLQRQNCSAVSLAVAAGRSPGQQQRETIPTKWHKLMRLINTALIICKLHVWVHITWETYAACPVLINKCQLIAISGAPGNWRRANQQLWRTKAQNKKKGNEEERKENKKKDSNKSTISLCFLFLGLYSKAEFFLSPYSASVCETLLPERQMWGLFLLSPTYLGFIETCSEDFHLLESFNLPRLSFSWKVFPYPVKMLVRLPSQLPVLIPTQLFLCRMKRIR